MSARTASAQSAPAQVTLHWVAPDECPDAVRLVHQIESLLGQSLLEAKGQALAVRASAQGNTQQGYAGKVWFTSARGTEERFLDDPSCDKLVEAMALVIALGIDPDRVRSTQSARESATGARSAPSLQAAPAPLAPERCRDPALSAPRNPEPRRAGPPSPEHPLPGMRVALHGLAGAGPLPSFGAGVEATLGYQPGRFRLQLLGRYWAPRDQAITITPSAKLNLSLVTLGARACWLLPSRAWRFSACGGADLGSEHGQGVGVANSRARDALYGQLSGGFEVAYARSPLVPEAGLEASAAVFRPRFGIREDGLESQVFVPNAWGFAAFFGLAFEL